MPACRCDAAGVGRVGERQTCTDSQSANMCDVVMSFKSSLSLIYFAAHRRLMSCRAPLLLNAFCLLLRFAAANAAKAKVF